MRGAALTIDDSRPEHRGAGVEDDRRLVSASEAERDVALVQNVAQVVNRRVDFRAEASARLAAFSGNVEGQLSGSKERQEQNADHIYY